MPKATKEKKKKKATKEKIGKLLKPQQEKFCRNYTQNSSMFGNATLSYADAFAYDLDSLDKKPVYNEEWDEETGKTTKEIIEDSEYKRAYDSCSVQAHHLLRNHKINERIVKLLNETLTDDRVDAELAKIIQQQEDLSAKRQAISEYNKVKQRITNKVKIEGLTLKDLYDAANK